jgi:hypothetical protein
LTVPWVGVSSPAMMDSKVLLPEPEAPTMAAVSRAASEKSISRKMANVPVESVTDLKTCSTEIIEAVDGFAPWEHRFCEGPGSIIHATHHGFKHVSLVEKYEIRLYQACLKRQSAG